MTYAKFNVRPGGLAYWCQACETTHPVNLDSAYGTQVWTKNLSNPDSPSFYPDLKVSKKTPVNAADPQALAEDYRRLREDKVPLPMLSTYCHHHIIAGKIRYHADCTHALAGTVQPLLDMPEDHRTNP